ncbi:hypothetical protein [Roseomonas marmotae]|uniref:Nucleotide-diphospho-sugar transferase domain-containing protein n=1 Tax=Roseomonas marmotae TaxID=2768161 RepID=A0ABS3KCV8_9PROT|nr:hypothetical protein [Roseomonas marmotae]MBO1074837.1 hypothetical protein [Roseomonas marmotae]QTI80657.1 hypothetical protein IAI58_08005 [Roseomonas marmotae]
MRALKPERDIVLIQSADPVNYFFMLRSTARINREFCLQHDIDYTCHQGIIRGFHPWQACYNRIFLINNLLDLGFTGWYLHLDADAWVHDVGFDIRAYLADCRDHSFVFALSASKLSWEVNDGIFLANLAHPDTRDVMRAWKEAAEAIPEDRLRQATNWYEHGTPGDQQLLQAILRKDDARLSAHIRHEPISFMNAPTSRVFRQLLRAQQRDQGLRLDEIQMRVGDALRQRRLPVAERVTTFCYLARLLGLPIPPQVAEIRRIMATKENFAAFFGPVLARTEAPPPTPPAAAPAP